MSYEHLAEVYDRLMEDAPYEAWVEFFEQVMERHQQKSEEVLELGCGTGEITDRLSRKGYRMTGVDLSLEMLSIASMKRDPSIRWIHQDITELEGFSSYGVIISFCDVLNYVTSTEGLASLFGQVHRSLREDGLFLFDVHSRDYAFRHLAGATFAEVYDDLSYIWFCDKEGEYLRHDLTFFTENNGAYERFDEEHFQRIHSVDEIVTAMEANGLSLVSIHSDFSLDENKEGDRLFFVCQKV